MKVDEQEGVVIGMLAFAIAPNGAVDEEDERIVELAFSEVAELRYTMTSFWDAHAGTVVEPAPAPFAESRGIYRVLDSAWHREGHEHFLVTGYDAYVEILARSFELSASAR